MIDLRKRLTAIKKTLSPDVIPISICRDQAGEISTVDGMNVLQPMLDGAFTDIVCNDPDIAALLRSMDTEKTVNIEIISLVNGELIRERI